MRYSEHEMIEAAKYGYEYHQTSQFPHLKFEEMAINNFKQVLESKRLELIMDRTPIDKVEAGERIVIPVEAIEFNVGSNTIWVQGGEGGTTLRIKCTGKILVDVCKNSPISHSDIMVDGDINFCISEDASK